jgi:PAS domain S-box-containing protein
METGGKTILVIDDESISKTIISRMLEKMGFTVITAADGATGLEIYRERAPDLIMVDLFMPEIDGFKVLTTIQAQSPETPVIVISATDRIGDVIRALRLGAWDFITKPVQDQVFLETTVMRAFEKAALTVENRLIRERIQAIVDAVPCGIVVVDAVDQTIMEVNPMAAEMIGSPVADIIGKKSPGFIYPDEPHACDIDTSDSTCVRAEHILLRHDGSRIPIHKTVTRTAIDGRACAIESFVDISEHKQAQLELVKRKKMQGVIEMAGAVCHEMNQPLQVISGLCELIMMDADEAGPFTDRLKTIRSQAGEMGRITGKLMGITRYRTKEHLEDRIIDIDEASEHPDR